MRQACRLQAETLLSRDRRIDWIDAQMNRPQGAPHE
jgi:hypothetical protein